MILSATTAHDAAVPETGGRASDAEPETAEILPGAPCSAKYAYLKRALDVIIGIAFTIVVAPLLLLICVLILLDTGRPVFYRQERVGARPRRRGRMVEWEERRFRIIKFRTMVADADSSPVHERFIESFVRGQLNSAASGTDHFKLHGDARVTRTGRFLRAASLDELPQLFNVLGGTMSLVGPRPVPPYEVALYELHHRERLAALPGITGPWQVDGRGRVCFEEMVRLDIAYVRRRSLLGDLLLLVRTPAAVFKKRGAS